MYSRTQELAAGQVSSLLYFYIFKFVHEYFVNREGFR